TADTAIHHDRNAAAHRFHDLGQALDGATPGIGGPATMLRHDDAIGTMAYGLARILCRLQPLDDHIHARHVLHAFDDLPGQACVHQPHAVHVQTVEDGLGLAGVVAVVTHARVFPRQDGS